MEQQTGSKLRKEYVKAIYCHPAYLTYMQSTSCEMLGKGEWKSWLKTQHSKNSYHGLSSHHFMAINGKQWKQWQILFSWAPKSLQTVTAVMKLKVTCSLEEKLDKPRQHIKKQRHYFANKGPSSQSYGFSRSHVWMWELDYKESWVPKNWCFWTVVLEKTLESPLARKAIQPINPEGNPKVLNVHWKDWCWSWNSNTLATWCKELTHWKRPWC